MPHSKRSKKDKGSHSRYKTEDHRRSNKIRRIKKYNPQQLDWWLQNYG